MSAPVSLQDRYFPDLPCFGCGPSNAEGLQLKSYEASTDEPEATVVATFRPWAAHDNGLGYLNGGIISTVLDCHAAAAATHTAHAHGWVTEGVPLPYVTASLEVAYRRPTPKDADLALKAAMVEGDEGAMTVRSWIEHDGKVRAEATSLWKRWRPRT
ncbi:MAG: thioesterase [Nocardioides sp.]|nr:thioesterase [Nocardioides sp.]